ncbi:hypothetical protein AS850_03245 [Frondihabitans sp. 762G35]|uniref:DUF3040 domain-containing protein n=1 Tax=Frondihabitans sp. 762G35 TaxID=1446794 RepID=UPI000D2039DC|nr:DUF3040 domain-containing protein [Frondihabitans sp. 762G35]ARC56090.1 hypothetical protein AS850_03245 [Frondihabitans sp. 762G35]
MGIGSWGGGIVLGLVAVLWLVYLIPSWHKRQEYLATERNAVRLQQTLRILAQTAELPEEVRVEANAKSVASAQRILRDEEAKREAIRRAQEAARQRAITRELAATAPALRAADSEPALAARRLRRTRLAATLVLVAGLVGFVLGVSVFAGAWLLLGASVVAGVGSVTVLYQLAAVSQARARRLRAAPAAESAAPPMAQEFYDFAPRSRDVDPEAGPQDARADADARSWTPVPMPRPLYLRRGTAHALARSSAVAGSPTTQSDADALRAAAERSADALRVRAAQEAARRSAQQEALREVARAEAALEARRSGGVAPVSPVEPAAAAAAAPAAAPAATAPAPAPAPAPPSRFARMGYVDETELQQLHLDEVLQRRRAV